MTQDSCDRIVVIGGGPAGLMAAIQAARRGLSVVLLEKNKMVGRKLRITGKGRCNITNECDFDTLLSNIPGNHKFLYSSFRQCSNQDIIAFFHEIGLPTVTERGNRVFPKSQNAHDVADVLLKEALRLKVHIRTNSEVTSIGCENVPDGKMHVTGVYCGKTFFAGSGVIVATGGISYPLTGSTGDGYRFAQESGHSVVLPRASLVGLSSPDRDIPKLEGLSLRNVALRLENPNGKTVFEEQGEMLFTAHGISGPLVLSGSRHILEYDYHNITAHIDLKPALTLEKLEERLKRDFIKYDRKHFINSLGDLLPSKLIPVFAARSNIPPDKQVNQMTREERKMLCELLKNFTVAVEGCESIERAVVTAGGVNVSEINPATMESRLCGGLYFAGEVLDVDGYTGGFNLTIAFSTGYAAGKNAGKK